MKNGDEISDRKKKWQRWTTVMSYSLIIWIISPDFVTQKTYIL